MDDQLRVDQDLDEELNRLRSELQEVQSKYTALVEESLTGIIVIQDACICFANRWVVDSSGYEPGELIGKGFLEFVHRDDRDYVRSATITDSSALSIPAPSSSGAFTRTAASSTWRPSAR